MTVTATEVFDFLEKHPVGVIDKREIRLHLFGNLRKGIRKIVTLLGESEEADSQEVADNLRMLLSEWLTVPVSFAGTLVEALSALGDPSSVESRWGKEVRIAYDLAQAAASELHKIENPVRAQIREVIHELRSKGTTWRIYCHRRARNHFESIFPQEPLPADFFLHSVKDYRESRPFDTLIKMGPLRSKGWGSAPDAVLSAPRFETLVQIVWAGCADEDDFGYDPAAHSSDKKAGSASTKESSPSPVTPIVSWRRNLVHLGDGAYETSDTEFDELKLFREMTRAAEMRRATLVQIDDSDGILYPPHSQVPTFDPLRDAEDPFAYRLPGETLSEGMFLIWPVLGTADLGDLHSGEGHYSRVWKARLREKFKYTPNDLMRGLREGGIELRHLRSCIRQWCKPASTVIHAPQQRRHFEALISVLGIDEDSVLQGSHPLRHPWWQYAWAEIAHARGEAIQSGLQEHEIVDEQLFLILRDLLPDLQHSADTLDVFQIELPKGKPLQGQVRFYRVRSIEDGFLVPDTLLKVISDLDTVEQWRV